LVAHFARWLRGLDVPADVMLNLLADELVVPEAGAACEVRPAV
jgi:hypothetical protein